MNNILKNLRLCMNEDEVWYLFKNVKLSPDHDIEFGSKKIILPNAHNFSASVNLPNNTFGLMVRIVAYLRFNGYLGHINYSGGAYSYLGLFRTLWNDFNTITPLSGISDISEELIESWIKSQIDKNYQGKTIMGKFRLLSDWLQASPMLPYFLTIENMQIYDCPSYLKLEEKYLDDVNKREREEPPTYPIHLLLPILEEALKYITKYTNDIDILMEQRYFLNDRYSVTRSTLDDRTQKFMKTTKYNFQEPSLAKLQAYCKKIKRRWYANPEVPGKGPRVTITDAVNLWQAANLIILGFFTAARSQEISRQPRYIKITKTKYHEIDQSYNFTRIIWKTDRKGKLHTMPVPPIALKSYQNLSMHSEQIDGKTSGHLKFTQWSDISSKMSISKMRNLLIKFSNWVHGKDSPCLVPHQLRHAMASMLSYLNDHNGLLMAAKLLGHESTLMTLAYQAQIKTIVLNKFNHIANSNIDMAEAFKEYEIEESLKILNEKVMPDLNAKKFFIGPAKEFVQFTGSIVHDAKSFFEFHSQAIKDGKIVITQTPTNLCIRTTAQSNQMICQRGITMNDYKSIPVQPAACQGSSCMNALFSEQNCEMLKEQTQSVKELVPEDLRKIASEWFYVVGDGLEMPNKKIIAEYEAKLKNKNKSKVG